MLHILGAFYHRTLSVLDKGTRDRMGRLLLAAVSLWFLSSLALFLVEPPNIKSGFVHLGDYLWGVVVYLFSGLENYDPQTVPGKVVAGLTLVLAVVFVAIFTAGAVAVLVELTRSRGMVPRKSRSIRLRNHTIICGRGGSTKEIVNQLRSDRLSSHNPIVIVATDADEVRTTDLPQHRWWRPLDVWGVALAPDTNEALRCADIESAAAVIVLARTTDDQGRRRSTDVASASDAEALRIALLVRSLHRGVPLVVEVRHRANRGGFWRAGATDLVTPGVIAARMLAAAVLAPGSSRVFGELMSTTSSTSEPYVVGVPHALAGITFDGLLRSSVGQGIVPVAIRSGRSEAEVNPDRDRVISADDRLVVIGSDEQSIRTRLASIAGNIDSDRRS